MNFTITKASFDDVEEICATQMAAIEDLRGKDYSDQEIHAWAATAGLQNAINSLKDPDKYIYVARDKNGMVVGFCGLRDNQITDVYVDPDVAGNGIGSTLLRYAEWQIRKNGKRNIRLISSLNSVDFYKEKGYNPLSTTALSVDKDTDLDMVEMGKKFSGDYQNRKAG